MIVVISNHCRVNFVDDFGSKVGVSKAKETEETIITPTSIRSKILD